eukprot:Rhum_TRINITY_DN15339_c5_g1::Rhum_TRINITY_DN15339_c5_g1_i1::g.150918::m.150918
MHLRAHAPTAQTAVASSQASFPEHVRAAGPLATNLCFSHADSAMQLSAQCPPEHTTSISLHESFAVHEMVLLPVLPEAPSTSTPLHALVRVHDSAKAPFRDTKEPAFSHAVSPEQATVQAPLCGQLNVPISLHESLAEHVMLRLPVAAVDGEGSAVRSEVHASLSSHVTVVTAAPSTSLCLHDSSSLHCSPHVAPTAEGQEAVIVDGHAFLSSQTIATARAEAPCRVVLRHDSSSRHVSEQESAEPQSKTVLSQSLQVKRQLTLGGQRRVHRSQLPLHVTTARLSLGEAMLKVPLLQLGLMFVAAAPCGAYSTSTAAAIHATSCIVCLRGLLTKYPRGENGGGGGGGGG